MKNLYSLIIIALYVKLSLAQIYTEQQTRHRFAQLNLGMDLQTSWGGQSAFLNRYRSVETLSLPALYSPRFIIGGTHFWGHADFYIAIPLSRSKYTQGQQEVKTTRSVETVFKYYPWRITHHKIRPYVGISIAPIHFQHFNQNLPDPEGPELVTVKFPLLMGFTFNSGNHLIEIGGAWNYQANEDYYLSPRLKGEITLPQWYTSIGYKYMLDTTIGAEKDWESGRTKEVTDALAKEGKLNGLFVGAGMSAAFWLLQSEYNAEYRPYLAKYPISLLADFSAGYYFHEIDVNLTIGYRSYKTDVNTYGTAQQLQRKSLVFEPVVYLFDYHGFVPFLGPAISHERLSFTETKYDLPVHQITENKVGLGATFGWDIRPNRVQSWVLRTNLRWYPDLNLAVNDQNNISFSALEFNFIQLIIYPNRLF